jgi:hypothetical protein
MDVSSSYLFAVNGGDEPAIENEARLQRDPDAWGMHT